MRIHHHLEERLTCGGRCIDALLVEIEVNVLGVQFRQ
jgi:hypothetical protein